MRGVFIVLPLCAWLAACGSGVASAPDSGAETTENKVDSGTATDAGTREDAGSESVDAGTEETTPDAGGDTTTDAGGTPDAGVPANEPPALPAYASGTCPVLTGGPTAAAGQNVGFVSKGISREFRVLVPPNYDGTKELPLLFLFHWLKSSSEAMVQEVELETAVAQEEFIAVVPEHRKKSDGSKEFLFDWPFAETQGQDEDLAFVSDLLACVGRQWKIDRSRIGLFGVSAGGFWATDVAMAPVAQHFASVTIVSAGLGKASLIDLDMAFTPPPVKFAAFVIWGGDDDKWPFPASVNFKDAATKWRDNLKSQGHFVVQCVHDQGHKVPPFESVGGAHRFAPFWRFLKDHRWGATAGTSPWQAAWPAVMPSWCSIP